MVITMKLLPINFLFCSFILTNHVIESTKNLNNNNPSNNIIHNNDDNQHHQRSTLSDKDYENFRDYTILTSQEIKSRMEGLASKYHNLVTLNFLFKKKLQEIRFCFDHFYKNIER